jgi:hypothetical protein
MSGAPAIMPPPPASKSCNLFQHLARASWITAIFGILSILGGVIAGSYRGYLSYAGSLIGLSIILCGIISGIVALFGLAQYGKRKILWPAIIGICLNFLFVGFGLSSLLFETIRHVRLGPASHLQSARLLKDEHLQFSIDIPEGFQEFPEGKQQPNDVYCFIRRSDDKKTAFAFTIKRLDRLIGRGLDRNQLGPDFKGEIVHPSWRGVYIDATVETVTVGESSAILYDIGIPLRPKAIRLMVAGSGPDASKDQVEKLVNDLLASLEGETNW